MVYITNESGEMIVLRSENSPISKIELINQTDKTRIVIELEQEEIEYNKNSIVISLDNKTKDLKTGQYDYYLKSNENKVVQSGILQFNNFNKEIETYNFEEKIIQYGE